MIFGSSLSYHYWFVVDKVLRIGFNYDETGTLLRSFSLIGFQHSSTKRQLNPPIPFPQHGQTTPFQALICVQQTAERITTTTTMMTSPLTTMSFYSSKWGFTNLQCNKIACTLTLLDEDRFLTAAAAVTCECVLVSAGVVPCTGATALVT